MACFCPVGGQLAPTNDPGHILLFSHTHKHRQTHNIRYFRSPTSHQERKATTTTVGTGSLGRVVSSVSHHLPDEEARRNAARRVAESTKAGGGRALQALKRASRRAATHQRQAAQGTANDPGSPSMARRGQGKTSPDGNANNIADEELDEGIDVLSQAENPWDPFVGFEAKAGGIFDTERHWGMTEQFYAHLTIAVERLEAKRTAEKG